MTPGCTNPFTTVSWICTLSVALTGDPESAPAACDTRAARTAHTALFAQACSGRIQTTGLPD